MNQYRIDEDKEKALIKWVYDATDITTYWARQDVAGSRRGKLQDKPFCTLDILSIQSIDRADKIYKTTDTWELVTRKILTVTLNIYAQNKHFYYMDNVIDALNKESVLTDLRIAGLSYWSHTSPVDISELIETRHELRVTMDVVFSYAKVYEDEIGEIQTVKLEKTNSPTFETEITIP